MRYSVIQPSVVAVVVTYNRRDLLEECICALLQSDYCNLKIAVVDNASSDGTEELVRSRFSQNPAVHYFNTGKNLGGAGGFNYGMKKAMELGCDRIWLMDDDCIVRSDSLSKLIEADQALKGGFGFLCSKVLWKDGSMCRMNIPKISFSKKIEGTESSNTPVIFCTFVSFYLKTDTVREMGYPISDFFIWADDLEYSRRISRVHQSYFVPDSVVVHKSNMNIGSDLAADHSKDLGRYSFAYRNEYYVFRREGIQGRIYYTLKVLYHKAKIRRSKDRSEYKIKLIDKAVAEGRTFDPPVEMVRSEGNSHEGT